MQQCSQGAALVLWPVPTLHGLALPHTQQQSGRCVLQPLQVAVLVQ
jgi:hypothetical protein